MCDVESLASLTVNVPRKVEGDVATEKVVVWDFAQDTIMGIGAVACR